MIFGKRSIIGTAGIIKSEKQAEEVKELQKEVEELRKQLASGLGILK